MLALLVASSVAAGLRHRTSSAHPDASATLGVLTIFRNEEQVLTEWVAHYRAEGVTQFVMIDDRSTDGSAALAHSLSINGDITVVPSEGAGTQDESLRARAPLLTTEWIFVCDLDEFAFGKTMTIGAYLATVPDECGGVNLPWITFASAEKHPVSLIESNRMVWQYSRSVNMKMLVRRSALCSASSVWVHYSFIS